MLRIGDMDISVRVAVIRMDGLAKVRNPKDALRAHTKTPHGLKQRFARTALTIKLHLDKSMHDYNRCN
jgi:hypothetical protein